MPRGIRIEATLESDLNRDPSALDVLHQVHGFGEVECQWLLTEGREAAIDRLPHQVRVRVGRRRHHHGIGSVQRMRGRFGDSTANLVCERTRTPGFHVVHHDRPGCQGCRARSGALGRHPGWRAAETGGGR